MKKINTALLLLAISLAGFSKTWTISNTVFTFTPSTITITLGDSVIFNVGNDHIIQEVNQTTWDANNKTPLENGFATDAGGGLILPEFLGVGTHYYVCTSHVSSGMKGIIIVEAATNIKRNEIQNAFTVYPNPSKGKFELLAGSLSKLNYTLDIYAIHGAKIYSISFENDMTSKEIDLSFFPKGIYILKLYNGKEIYNRKIYIE